MDFYSDSLLFLLFYSQYITTEDTALAVQSSRFNEQYPVNYFH